MATILRDVNDDNKDKHIQKIEFFRTVKLDRQID